MSEFDKLKIESEEDYKIRICGLKDKYGFTWQEVAEIINKELGLSFDESAYRKMYTAYAKGYEKKEKEVCEAEGVLDKYEEAKLHFYKEKIKAADVKRELMSDVRKEARADVIKDEIVSTIRKMPAVTFPKIILPKRTNEGVLLIGDWHIGAKVDNFYNTYNLEEAKKRIKYMVEYVKKYIYTQDIERLHIINLGDMIEGSIHVSTRVTNELNTCQQIIDASNLIFNFIGELSTAVNDLNYHSVTSDNHGRVIQNYKDNLEAENFSVVMDNYIRTRCEDCSVDVNIYNDNLDNNFGVFELLNGKKFGYTHGHTIPTNKAYQAFTGIIQDFIDYIAIGHFHSSKMKEFNASKVYVNGTLKGVDDYAIKNYLFARPSQSLIVFDGENDLDFRINFPKKII